MKSQWSAIAWIALSTSLVAQSVGDTTASGYLSHSKTQHLLQLSGLPPENGDTRDVTDRAVFKATRSVENSARWKLAQADANLSVAGIMNAFSCSLGVTPTVDSFPELNALMERVIADSNAVAGKIKNEFKRKRPFLVDQGPTCVNSDGYLSKSFDFPSGHATSGWVAGLILAELWPTRATEILERARQYGESRVFCGVHNISAVEAARTVGGGVVAMLHGSPAFRRDLEAVRAEVAHGQHKTRSKLADSCSVQAKTLATNPYASSPVE